MVDFMRRTMEPEEIYSAQKCIRMLERGLNMAISERSLYLVFGHPAAQQVLEDFIVLVNKNNTIENISYKGEELGSTDSYDVESQEDRGEEEEIEDEEGDGEVEEAEHVEETSVPATPSPPAPDKTTLISDNELPDSPQQEK